MSHLKQVIDNPQEYLPPEEVVDDKGDCPVLPLGFDGKNYYFLDARKQVIEYNFRELNKSGIDSLFAPYKNWLWRHFPKKNEQGEIVNINYERVKDWLQEKAAYCGKWDSDRLRGAGCWLGEQITKKTLYMHCGDKIYDNDNNVYDVGFINGYVYEQARTDIIHPVEQDVGNDDMAMAMTMYKAEELLAKWNWNRSIDIILLLGWIAAAIMGGALKWRPMVFITGDKATGKSTLQEVIQAIIGKGGLVSGSNVTSAGIYQQLKNSTLPIILDEMEADANEGQRQKDILNLIRSASTGSAILRGGENHKGHSFEIRSCFLMAGIIPPPMRPQELSRMTIMRLNKITVGDELNIDETYLREIGSFIRRKILQEWHRFDETLILYQSMLMSIGYESRSADQFGTLLACHDLLIRVSVPKEHHLQQFAEKMALDEIIEVSQEQTDAEKCLHVILQLHTDYHDHNVKESISYVLAGFLRDVIGELPGARKRLRSCDMGLVRSKNEHDTHCYFLAIPNTSKILTEKLKDTAWSGAVGSDGGWTATLTRLDNAIASKVVNFSGVKRRATLIPLDQYIERSVDEEMSEV